VKTCFFLLPALQPIIFFHLYTENYSEEIELVRSKIDRIFIIRKQLSAFEEQHR
jgi:hypothetical protein